ncbi:LuxR C-terminal-related transcriptional regulator [Clostridium sp.]|uniref:helix-turn-helix transcriptional regulator n=1 Tax=Clostridium sp. TaxID=1506 RepID=UPI00284CF539|nr:LuxR C-terminal-related transcriptional regulator [Clostridium sp.]MDR3596084.1 LuxR C-terminal-related transcriptional regulator [Clostridium sp.]
MSKYNTKSLYFTDKVRNKLKGISEYPLTIVTAPMGYGKTTSVKNYLYNSSEKVLWTTIYDGSVVDFWMGFCEGIENIDEEVANNLKQMGFPADIILKREMVKLMRKINFETNVFWVIDDYHLVTSMEVDALLTFLIYNIPKRLHLVIISRRNFLDNKNELMLKGFLNNITSEDLAFEPMDIAKYFEVCGVKINKQEVNKLYKYSEGWISSLYLYMLEYLKKGSISKVSDIELLVNETVYSPLSLEAKEFLFNICIFDAFSREQAQYMLGEKDKAEKYLTDLINNNSFIQYDKYTKKYALHKIFSNFINVFFEKKDDSFKKYIWKKAGQWYVKECKYMSAEDFFYKAEEFDLLLSTIEVDKGRSIEKEHKEKIMKYITNCPKDVKERHHLVMLIYLLCLFTFNEMELFQKVCAEVNKNIHEDHNLTSEKRNNYLAEYELIVSFAQYNDIEKMSEHHKKACKLVKDTSAILDPEDNWTFGSPSVLYMFHREIGKLSEEIEIMKKAMPYYNKLTNNHGNSAEDVMEAESFFYKFEFESADVSVYRAMHKLNDNLKSGLKICLIFLKIRMAILKGDYIYATEELKKIRQDIIDKKLYMYIRTIDLLEAYIYCLLDQPQMIPDWIADGDFNNTTLLFPAIPALNIIYGKNLLVKKEYIKLIGISEYFEQIADVFPNIICHVYINIHLAASYYKVFNNSKALFHLKKALDIAMPDKLYIPFVENASYIYSMMDELVKDTPYKEEILIILDESKKYITVKDKIIKENFNKNKFGLTEKETETAELAAKGFTNKEIAQKLFVSENTVKLRLKNIFIKLNIKSRAELRN